MSEMKGPYNVSDEKVLVREFGYDASCFEVTDGSSVVAWVPHTRATADLLASAWQLRAENSRLKDENKQIHGLAVQSHSQWLLRFDEPLDSKSLAASYTRWVNQENTIEQLRAALQKVPCGCSDERGRAWCMVYLPKKHKRQWCSRCQALGLAPESAKESDASISPSR